MKKFFTLLLTVILSCMGMQAQALIDYPNSNDGISVSGTTVEETVKIHLNKDAVPCLSLKNGYTSSSKMNGNHIMLSVDGGFKAGDMITVAGAINNSSDAKRGAPVLFTSEDGEKTTKLTQFSDFINGRLVEGDPVEETYTLEADYNVLYIGRDGDTGTALTLIKVERGGGGGTTPGGGDDPTPGGGDTPTPVVNPDAVAIDFTANKWELPEGSSEKTNGRQEFTNGKYTVVLEGGAIDEGYYFQTTDKYLMLGKQGASLQLPPFDFDVEVIEVVGREDASAQTVQNIYVDDTPVSTSTVGSKGTSTFRIAEVYQTAGTIYTIRVLDSHYSQITKINVHPKGTYVEPVVGPDTPTGGDNVIWAEDWTGYAKNDVPSAKNENYSEVSTGSDTKIYEEALSGSASPELLIAKSGGAFTAKVDLKGATGDMSLAFMSNHEDYITVTIEPASVTIGDKVANGSDVTYPINVPEDVKEITITFTNNKSSNARFDEVVLSQGAVTPSDPDTPVEPTKPTEVSVAKALEIVAALEDGKTTSEDYIVKGFIVGTPDFQRNASDQLYGNVNFDIADEKGGTTLLTIFRAQNLNNVPFNEETILNTIKEGDEVEVIGKLQKYVKDGVVTPELTKGYLKSVNEGGTTAITNVNNTTQDAPIFNLAGQQVKKTTRGVYVQNGKKFIVK